MSLPSIATIIGIGTDGFRWKRFTKHLGTRTIVERDLTVDIEGVVTSIGRDHGPLSGDPDLDRKAAIEELESGLVDQFGARTLPEQVSGLSPESS